MNKIKASQMEKILIKRIEELENSLNVASSSSFKMLTKAQIAEAKADSYLVLFKEQDKQLSVMSAKISILKRLIKDCAPSNEIFDFIQNM